MVLGFGQPEAHAAEPVLMRVFLNHADAGEQIFLLDGATPLFTPGALRSMGLVKLPDSTTVRIGDVDYLSLDALKPAINYQIDEREVVLYVFAPPEYFRQHTIEPSGFAAPEDLQFTNQSGAFLNYGVDYSYQDKSSAKTLTLPFELLAHQGKASAYSNFIYTNNERESGLVRLMSAVTMDYREPMTRLTIGDFAAFGGRDGGSEILGGLSYSRIFSINPYFNRYTGLLIDGTVNSPSQVDYFVDDQLLFSHKVPPGQFVLRGVTPPTGAHRTRMVFTDTFGNTTATEGAIYYASRLLKPGVHEFSYNIGFRRRNFGRDSSNYDEPAAVGFHRLGINRSLTLGARGEFDEAVSNIGGEAQFRLARFGQASMRLSASRAGSETGSALSADYQFFSSFFHTNVLFRVLSKSYANLSLKPGADKPQYEWRTAIGANSWDWGNLTASYATREMHGGSRSHQATVSYSKLLGRFATLLARYTRVGGDQNDRQIFMGVSIPFGHGQLAAIEYRSNRSDSLLSGRLSKNRSLGPGLGYDFNAGLQSGDANAAMATEYGGKYGVYSAGYRRVNNENAFRIGAAGSISWIGGGMHFSRPIRESFALIQVADLQGVDVLLNNQFIGKTNQDGLLLAPGLNPYYGNRLSINDQDIPVNYELSDIEHVVATPFRGGGTVSFKTRKLQAFTGMFFVTIDGERRPAEHWGLRYEIGGQSFESAVGNSGVFYLENILARSLEVTLFSSTRVCNVTLAIPDSSEMYVDLGEIDCEITN
jgi:outer membrane usher protein